MIRLAVQSRLIPGDSLREKHETALQYGFDGIELSGFPMIDLAREAIRDKRARECDVLGSPRLVHRSGSGQQIAACKEDVRTLLELGAELDAPLIIVPIYGRTHNLPPHCGTGRTREEDEALWLDGLREVDRPRRPGRRATSGGGHQPLREQHQRQGRRRRALR
jgi:sugar phosphate isomerase/epimerase